MGKILAFGALALAAPCALAVAPPGPSPAYRDGELIVKYAAGARAVPAKRLRSDLGLTPLRALLDGRAELLAVPAYMSVEDAIAQLHDQPGVEYAEPNFRRFKFPATPNDPLFPVQWGLRNTGQAYDQGNPAPPDDFPTAGADLNMAEAWDGDGNGVADRTGNGSVIVAIVDDGFQLNHPDLAANFTGVPRFDFAGNDADPSPGAGDEHGTLVAGCVGAVGNNLIGVAGAAWNVKLMPLRFDLDVAQFVAAMQFVRDNGAAIINASFGGPSYSQAEFDGITDLRDNDILLVAAAGNSDSNTDLGVANYPANYDLPNVLAVAASNRGDNITGFSQYGPTAIDAAAPGIEIRTTAVGSTYASVSGTSFSSPYTAGIAALIKMSHPAADYREIKARIVESGVGGEGMLANASARRTRGGRIDADRALDMTAQPSLVLKSVSVADAGNGRLDPGEAATLEIVVENLWVAATGVSARLDLDSSACSGPVGFDSTAQSLPDIAQDGTATASFALTPAASIAGHCYVPATLHLSANGGYARTRHLILEIGRLELSSVAQGSLQTDKFDEFHAWHLDLPTLPAGTTGLRFRTSAPSDIDLLVKRITPPQYDIQLFFLPEPGEGQLFFTDADLVGATETGVENEVLPNPQPGTYHIVIVNFSQEQQSYTLRADLIHPGVFVLDDDSVDVDESAGTVTVTVLRTLGTSGTASVRVAATAGTAQAGCDFTNAAATLSWADGETAPKTATLPIVDDNFVEADETFTVSLTNPVAGILGTPSSGTVTILDADSGDPAEASNLSFASSTPVATESQPAVISVTRTCGGVGLGPASVQFATAAGTAAPGTDYQETSGTLSWAAGDTSAKSFTVTLINDGDREGGETVALTLSGASGASLGLSSASLFIADDDAAQSSGGGGGSATLASLLVLLLAAGRRRLPRRV